MTKRRATHLLNGTVPTQHPLCSLHWVVFRGVMAHITGICLTTTGEPTHMYICKKYIKKGRGRGTSSPEPSAAFLVMHAGTKLWEWLARLYCWALHCMLLGSGLGHWGVVNGSLIS